MSTPCFPAFRSRLAALGRRTVHSVRQATLAQLQEHLRDFLPAPLLSIAEDGPNSRERVFTLRLTFECFVWQLLQPKTACREVVRQVQARFRLHDQGPVAEGDSAYVQARRRLPRERLEQALMAMARARNQKLRRQLWEDLLANLARDLVRLRPNRTEPRAVKRRPKPYPLLNRPRRRFVEISHRSRDWKGRPRNYRSLI